MLLFIHSFIHLFVCLYYDIIMLQLKPVAGLVYYLSPPASLMDAFRTPVHTVVYVTIMLCSCAWFSKIWIEVSGESAREVANNIRRSRMMITNLRDDVKIMQKVRSFVLRVLGS